MDLGIKGRRAIICAGSKGLGRATAFSLAREGVDLVLFARTQSTLDATADEIRRGRQIPGDFRTFSRDEWLRWIDAQMLSAMALIQAVVPGMTERRFGRIINITVSFVKFPQIGFAHSHAARLALTGAVASIARELVPHNITVNNVLPGLVETDALTTNLRVLAERAGRSYEDIVAERLLTCPAGRFADPKETGDLIAYLCSAQAGFITAQNIVQDGGVYQGVF